MKIAYSVNFPYEAGEIKVGEYEDEVAFVKAIFAEYNELESLAEGLNEYSLGASETPLVDYLIDRMYELTEADLRYAEIE